MTGRRALVGLALLCALAFTALSAASASAVTTGTTAVTCVKDPEKKGDYTDEHCDTTGTPEKSEFKHVTIAQDTATAVVGSNAKTNAATTGGTNAVLLATVGGVNVEIVCTTVASKGTQKNSLVGEDHRITGSNVVITYTGCTVANPAGCTVNSPGQAVGTGVTNPLVSVSVEGTPMTQKFEPEKEVEGKKVFIELEIKGCAIAGKYKVEGSVSAEPSGQMANASGKKSAGCTLIVNLPKNASSTLIVAGQKAGLTQKETVSMEGGSPIATTGPPF